MIICYVVGGLVLQLRRERFAQLPAYPQNYRTNVLPHHGIVRRHVTTTPLALIPRFILDHFSDDGDFSKDNGVEE